MTSVQLGTGTHVFHSLTRSALRWEAGPHVDRWGISAFLGIKSFAAKNVDYALFAKASGYPRTYSFTELDPLVAAMPEILGQPGPVFVALKVNPDVENKPIGERVRWRKRSWTKVISDLQRKLGIAA